MIYYVDQRVGFPGDGSQQHPFKRIQQAADIAMAGDTVLVAPGVYRERVNPVNKGQKGNPVTYKSMEPLQAHITGAEVIDTWQQVEGNVWVCRINNDLFGDFNPYILEVEGDWYMSTAFRAHRGEVYLNEKSMYETFSLDEVKNPKVFNQSWDKEFTIYKWYTTQENNETVIYANFQGKNPNKEQVEISVRPTCFFPENEGVNYITFSGFTVSKAATNWAPPTAYQEGMIGPHWSKGWVIEDCHIYESKCSGISLGKYLQPENENKWLYKKYKDGTQTQRECVIIASREGWDKENIGSHTVRRCHIHDCGQTGIVGHMGCVFSLIENNHIHHVCFKQNLGGAELGEIKLHAAIDTIIRCNTFHDCFRGIWLDWQAQGTRVSRNLFFDNCKAVVGDDGVAYDCGEDIFVEVSHGPTLIDNNMMLSDNAGKIATQGLAFVHNLIAGSFTAVGRGTDNGAPGMPSPRYTPYHVPHSTALAGFMSFLHGDCRFYNNIFVQQEKKKELVQFETNEADSMWNDGNLTVGTVPYDEYPTEEEYKAEFEGFCGMGAPPSNRYYIKLPVWASGNVYFNGAVPMKKETDAKVMSDLATIEVTLYGDNYQVKTNVFDLVKDCNCSLITTATLGMAFEPEERFENPDGTEIIFNEDYNGTIRNITSVVPGPIA